MSKTSSSLSSLTQATANSKNALSARKKAANIEWATIQSRDQLQASWENISVPRGDANFPDDYERWHKNILAFCLAAKASGHADRFLNVVPATSADAIALSLINVGLTDGESGIARRLTELSANADRDWMAIFRSNDLFWRALTPEKFTSAPTEVITPPDPEAVADSIELNGQTQIGKPTGYLGGTELCDALGIHASRRNAFFRALERNREKLGDKCWIEVSNRRPNTPHFLYQVNSPQIRDLAYSYKRAKLS